MIEYINDWMSQLMYEMTFLMSLCQNMTFLAPSQDWLTENGLGEKKLGKKEKAAVESLGKLLNVSLSWGKLIANYE